MTWKVEIKGKGHDNLSLKKIFDLRHSEGLVICGSPGKFISYEEFSVIGGANSVQCGSIVSTCGAWHTPSESRKKWKRESKMGKSLEKFESAGSTRERKLLSLLKKNPIKIKILLRCSKL